MKWKLTKIERGGIKKWVNSDLQPCNIGHFWVYPL